MGRPRRSATDRRNDLLARRVFEQITRCTGTNRVKDPLIIIIGGKDKYLRRGILLANLPGGLNAIHDRHP